MPFNNQINYTAGGTIAPCRFIKGDTSADEQVLQGSAGSACLGITQEGMKGTPGLAGSDTTIAAIAGDQIRAFGLGDNCLLECGAAVTRYDLLKSDSTGRGITASATDECGAVALQSGAGAGSKIRVQILNRKA